MLIAFGAIGCNIALKLLLGPRLGGPGLALATSAGAWINLVALLIVARRWGWMGDLATLLKPMGAIAAAGCLAALVFAFGRAPILSAMVDVPASFRAFAALLAIGILGLAAYAFAIWSLARMFNLRGMLRR
jgi:putative peptidoglycan lipid II flippase